MKDLLDIKMLTQIFENLPFGIGVFQVLDLNDIKSIRYVFMNKVVLYEMRKKKEEVLGKRIIEVAPEAYENETGLEVIEAYRKIAAEGGSVNLGLVEYSNHMVAGIYECSVHHIKDNYVYVMLKNVTELEQAKNELKLKNKEIIQFAAIVSHDLKEPLNTISSVVQLIKETHQEKLDKQASELFNFISDSTNRMRNVITDLLDYSHIGNGKEMVMVDCRKLIEVVQEDLATTINETNTSIDVGELPNFKGFETELRLLFQNLISNSIKFRKTGIAPKIKITAKEQDGWTFAIQDNGIGIADEQKDKIFNVFERLHSSREYEGSGIGLAHCKKIIDLHKGEIWVNSNPDEGSTFYFRIPTQL